MSTPLLLTGFREASGEPVSSLLLRDGLVAEQADTEAATASSSDIERLDLSGYLVLPALVEPHAHLDKALTWDAIGPGTGGLDEAIEAWAAWAPRVTPADSRRRVLNALRLLLLNGCTAVRSHVDVAPGPTPLASLEVLLAIREELRDTIDIQVVAFIMPGCQSHLIDSALALGPDLLGGLPHVWDDPAAEQRRLLDHAERAGVGLDLHTDERLDAGAHSLRDLATEVLTRSFASSVTASHCVSLGQQDADVQRATIGLVAEAGIGVVSMPQTNLYLQARGSGERAPRGLPPLRSLIDAGVGVAGGGDNLRDPFNPLGRADPLETAALLVSVAHLSIPEAVALVSTGARQLLGLPPADLKPGSSADLVAVRAGSLAEAVAAAPAERIVVKRGRVVARTTLSQTTALGTLTVAPQ